MIEPRSRQAVMCTDGCGIILAEEREGNFKKNVGRVDVEVEPKEFGRRLRKHLGLNGSSVA
jgi:hypothetical protein